MRKLPLMWTFFILWTLLAGLFARAEVILQYFQMPWRSMTQKMPELAEAGYTALWLPPPTKASGGLSVGYDLWDPFDLGNKDQRGGVRTFYGTKEELLEMMETAHRFGIRVYFDNIMNHRAFDVPGFNESTPIDIYPGMRPEDFHLRVTEDGFYRKWDNTRNWNDEWQVLHLGLSDLIDIAHEAGMGGWNHNFGPTEGSHHPGISFVRHPENPEYYDYAPNGDFVGFGNVTQEMLDDNPGAYTENVNAYLMRAVRWKMAVTRADGLRLDAVKHVPAMFFGAMPNEDQFVGYTGNIQLSFMRTRGFDPGSNPRESLFDINKPRNSAMIFGEHLGTPPAFEPYIDRGMRLKDAPLRDSLNGFLGSPWGTLAGMDQPGFSGHPAFNQHTGVSFPHSHDSDFASARELQYAYIMTREGLPIVYTDGYFKAGTLQDSGGAFPRHANTNFLGQFNDPRLPNLAYIREHFARGGQLAHWSDNDVVAYSRIDKRDSGWGQRNIGDGDGFTMLFMMNDNYADGQARAIGPLPIAATSGGSDTWLVNYSTYGGPFGVWASQIANGEVIIPPGGYLIFSFRTPEGSSLWGGNEIRIYQDGEEPDTVRVTRRDGPNGDASFNPYGLPNRGFPDGDTPEPFRYQMSVPRITSGENLRFVARANGLTENVMMKLNGGIDLNSQMDMGVTDVIGNRDHPPGASNDTFLGWEQAHFVHRQHAEKFAAADSTRNQIGSAGAETYHWNGGTDFTIVQGPDGANPEPFNNFGGTRASFIFHNPAGDVGGNDPGHPGEDDKQFEEGAEGITLWAKTNSVGGGFRMVVYYTMDGTNPEGAGGEGLGTTRAVAMSYSHDESGDDWWGTAMLPLPESGEQLRYKIGIFRDEVGGFPVSSNFPTDPDTISFSQSMMTVFEVDGFDATTIEYFPHNDWATDTVQTGLREGMNFIQARAFLNRSNGAALYNTFKQTFYLDLERPTGEVVFPAENDTLSDQEYGVVVRTDRTVTEVWFNIVDSEAGNDDEVTGMLNGNGLGEDEESSWVRAIETRTPSLDVNSAYPREWRFSYRNIPDDGSATIRVRLVELSSTPREDWTDTMSDVDGHFTTLERTVDTRGPVQRLFAAWPQNDGDLVGEGYGFKAYFTQAMADGTNEEELIERFTIFINGSALGRSDYSIVYGETSDYHALAYDLPNLFDGDPETLHEIEVRYSHDGVVLEATRLVRAVPTPIPPNVVIVDPEQFDSNGRQTEIILPDVASPTPEDRQYLVRVDTDISIEHVWIEFANDAGTVTQQGSPVTSGSNRTWTFVWSDMEPGTYTFTAYGSETEGGPALNSSMRTIPVRFRQMADADSSGDSDNDGLPDDWEITQRPLPETDSEGWENGDVHVWMMSGRTNPLMPVTDGGGLPDGLQVGLTGPIDPAATDITVDTNGDGFPNFIPDLDPPIFNTLDNSGHPRFNFNRSRTDLIGGSMTDPSRADTDNDGLRDSEEDLNRNGRVDIGLLGPDGKVEAILMHPNIPTVYNTSRVDREALPSNAVFLETDPNSADTIGDGLLDGQADLARNGRVNLYLLHENDSVEVLDYTDWNNPDHFAYNRMPNDLDILYWDNNNPPAHIPDASQYDFAPILSRAVHWDALFAAYNREGTGTAQSGGWPKLLITETDPLVIDTIGDGLPDGWKVRYGLDPLDDGVYNWRTGDAGDPRNGPAGDLTGDGVTNLQHFLAGTDPRIAVTGVEPPEDSIILGAGPEIGEVNGVTRFEEFMDWTWEDLRALDAFEGGGSNHQGGDIYPAFDGWDSSRDMTAFYVRDGGPSSAGGDDRIYFRVDFHDLQAFAEQGNLDLYVAINFGDTQNPLGERVLPDEVDTLTDMRWRAVVAVYESASGTVYVDTDPNNNTTTFGQSLTANGVVSRPDYFIGAYFNSELDAVEFAIDRQAVLDAGWLGDPAQLRYQVYTTKSGTQNSPQGPGDIGGRSDIRDSIMNDFIAENHWFAQQGLQGAGSVLNQWIPGDAWAGRVKVALVVHGNQSIRRGQEIQDLINNGQGAGYFRPLDTHEVYGVPLNLHITPTLAAAIQWAASDVSWRDGPAFNERLGGLIRDGVVQLFGTTFSDHILAYFDNNYNADNVALAHRILEEIYDVDMSGVQVFYPPERVLDDGVLGKIRDLGFNFTLVDQMMHIRHWFGREAALGTDGYRINNIHDVGTFALNDRAGNVKFDMHDSGAPMALRRQMNRMARSGTQDQVLVIHSAWEDFLDADNAAAYDALVRWMANRPWVEIVTLEDIAAGEVDLSRDGQGDSWWQIDRGSPALDKIAQEWIHFASREDYDNWYVGEDGFRQGLDGFRFQRRPGEDVEMDYGMQAANTGIAGAAWTAVNGIQNEDLRLLASGVLHASTFITAFHDQPTVDLRKFSDGSYIFPDGGFRELAAFARHNQAQTRRAAIYARVDQWAVNPPATTQTAAENIDLDGENEYLLYNHRLFAVMERTGGRMIAAWMRHPESGRVFQVVGNLMNYAGSDTEAVGTTHASAYRTSALNDWWAGTSEYVNDVYTFAPTSNGWTATSSDGNIVKTVTLADEADTFEVIYDVDSALNSGTLFVRHGLSPDLFSLLIHGQNRLSSEEHEAGVMTLRQGLANDFQVVSRIDTGDLNVSFQTSASDVPDGETFTTVNMRNQAQTHQVELEGQGTFGFTMSFSLETGPWFDSDSDGLPDWWEEEYFGGPTAVSDPQVLAANGVNTIMQAFIAGLDPTDAQARFATPMPEPQTGGTQNGVLLRLPFAIQGRRYTIWYTDDLMDPEWFIAAAIEAAEPEEETVWLDQGDQNRDNPLDVGKRFYHIEVELAPPE
ncbi:MAG: hypothetical protein LAT79_16785 [Kiritimatiellae bacterium]|nr:hypothetical protein [Kiritimatiellia bacterium]